MKEFNNILKLIADGKIKEAEILLGESKEEDGEYWYLGALIAFFKGNKEESLNFFLKSLQFEDLGNNTKEFAMRNAAYILFSKGEFKKSIDFLEKIERKTIRDLFVLFVSHTLIGNMDRGKRYLKEAYVRDKKKINELLKEFYNGYIKDNPQISHEAKTEFVNLIEKSKNN